MSEKNEDRRIRRTRRLLRDGLTKLMAEKKMQHISVRELTDLCDINRGTFYLHYRDIFDMVEQIEREIFDELDAALAEIRARADIRDLEPIIQRFLEFLAENSEMVCVLVGPNGDLAFTQRLCDRMRATIFEVVPARAAYIPQEALPYISGYMVSGAVGMVEEWLLRGMPLDTKHMSSIIVRVTLSAVMPGLEENTWAMPE